ncbi:MAG: LTA synthase family protein [Anaerovoracaceae bacterium]
MKKLTYIRNKFGRHYILISAILAILINLTIESLSRHSLIAGCSFLINSPGVFFFNSIIIFATYSIAYLFRRKIFCYVVISSLWLILGAVNSVILINRMTPFTTKDISNLGDGLSIVTSYLTPVTIVLSIIGAIAVVGGIVSLFIFAPKSTEKVNYKKSIAAFVIITLCALGVCQLAIKTHTVDTYFANLGYAYRDYGLPYCFISTWLNTGVDKPAHYSKDMIQSIFTKGELGKDGIYESKKTSTDKEHPNIIFLQLESFIDPLSVEGLSYSEDPIPNFRKMMKKYSSGYLTVPSVGAGTANTEFEALTGISLKFFGPGEYPYKSVLQKRTSESLPYDLGNLGYSSHAIHNHRGAFYGRNKVFSSLGFDTFTSLEYMNNVVKTQKSWAKDSLLIDQISDALNSTKNEDFIYTISVQGHGKYPTEKLIGNPKIKVTKAPNEATKWQYEYYVNQLYEMDLFVKELTQTLENYGENTVLVMYGDHLPALDMSEEQMKNNNLFQTQYVVWNNFDLKKEDKDLAAYQLSAQVLNQVDIHKGLFVKYHQNYQKDKNYIPNLQALAYDTLYGKKYIYGGKSPFKPTDLQMGIKKIKVKEVVKIGEDYFIKGQNFTEYSKVSLDGEILNTVYLGPTILALNDDIDPKDASKMKISQVEKKNSILSTTE